MATNNSISGVGSSLATAAASSAVKPTAQQPKATPTAIDDPSNQAASINPLNTAAAADNASADLSGVTGNLGEHDFLTLLVNQLQHQDPLNPMDPKEFSGQLAQFSTVEQLISINKKLDQNGSSAVSSMASYLGQEVVLKDQKGVDIKNGDGPNLLLDIPSGTQSLRIDLQDSSGAVAKSFNIDSPEAGQQLVSLAGSGAKDGNYGVRVVSVDSTGRFKDIPPKVTGTVEGFVLEPSPKLLIGGNQVGLEDVVEVYKGRA
ncbi:MAG: flagellar hook capping FlgD N-terminal domain-containing protein [Bdellovibrionota bacterium]